MPHAAAGTPKQSNREFHKQPLVPANTKLPVPCMLLSPPGLQSGLQVTAVPEDVWAAISWELLCHKHPGEVLLNSKATEPMCNNKSSLS